MNIDYELLMSEYYVCDRNVTGPAKTNQVGTKFDYVFQDNFLFSYTNKVKSTSLLDNFIRIFFKLQKLNTQCS